MSLALHLTLAVALTGASACERERTASPDAAPAPATQRRRTTSGEIALQNLVAQIDGQERRAVAARGDIAAAEHLVELLLLHSDVLGRIDDLERVLEIADDVVAENPADGRALLLAARAHARLHRFDEARRELAEAQRRGASADAIEVERIGLDVATGALRAALPIYERRARERPTLQSVGVLAAVLGEDGQLGRARSLFARAPSYYRDVSPFPFAWLELQAGLASERAGDSSTAAQHYRQALDRVPGHAAASSHLAAIEAREGRRDAAIRRLEALARQSDDPEHVGHLARLYREVGRVADGARLAGEARQRYELLLRRHPAAFADHAARFWLEVQGDANRASELALQNLALRRTPEAIELAVAATTAAGSPERACSVAREAAARPDAPARLRELVALRCAP